MNSPMVEARVLSVLKALKYSDWALTVAAEAVGLSEDASERVTSECLKRACNSRLLAASSHL